MSYLLPADPGPAHTTPGYLDWGGVLRPIFGGETQKLNRLGNRFALSVQMPPLQSEAEGRRWVASLILAQSQGAILAWPQLDLVIGAPGAPVVDGAGQGGSTLLLRGFSAGYAVRFGQMFSIIQGGRRYLHMAAVDANAGGDGRLALPIAPMLRMRPANGAICEFAAPMIEGLLIGDRREWDLDVARFVGLSFQIEEMK